MHRRQKALDEGEAWFLAQLKPGGLDRAILNLARQGYESFMPVRDETYRRAGRWRSSARPMFPGYLFVKVLSNMRHWGAINSTYGVSRLVALENGRPTQIAREIIDAMQVCVQDSSDTPAVNALRVGDRVKVVSGPLTGALAEIEKTPEQDRIYVLLEFMGRCARAELSPADVESRPADLMAAPA